MLHIAVCDDEIKIASKADELARVFFRTHCVDIKTQSYQSGEKLLYDLQDGIYYDLLLLDIEMPGIDGMDLAKVIHGTMPAAKIIFITSHLEYAITAYEFSVFRYIPKTLIDEKLPLALEDFYKLYLLQFVKDFLIIFSCQPCGSCQDVLSQVPPLGRKKAHGLHYCSMRPYAVILILNC